MYPLDTFHVIFSIYSHLEFIEIVEKHCLTSFRYISNNIFLSTFIHTERFIILVIVTMLISIYLIYLSAMVIINAQQMNTNLIQDYFKNRGTPEIIIFGCWKSDYGEYNCSLLW